MLGRRYTSFFKSCMILYVGQKGKLETVGECVWRVARAQYLRDSHASRSFCMLFSETPRMSLPNAFPVPVHQPAQPGSPSASS